VAAKTSLVRPKRIGFKNLSQEKEASAYIERYILNFELTISPVVFPDPDTLWSWNSGGATLLD
jgi:hypothetical protein